MQRSGISSIGAVVRNRASRIVLRCGFAAMLGAGALLVNVAAGSADVAGVANSVSSGAPFAGTAWELHAIQSMDDAQGTTRIPDPRRFTLRFETDGRATLQLDCNRGTGTWEVKAASDKTGMIRFGPIAATRALCLPPHLDERVLRDLAYVRGYLMKDGTLFLSLMADGGIYEWHPLRGE